MIKANNSVFTEIREYISGIPLIDTHEHYLGITEPVKNIWNFIMSGYHDSDMQSASFGNEIYYKNIFDNTLSFDERYSAFEKIYKKIKNTAYVKAFEIGLKRCWDIDEINLSTIKDLCTKLLSREQNFYNALIEKHNILIKIVDVCDADKFVEIINGTNKNYSKYCRFAFPLPSFHNIHSCQDIKKLEKYNEGMIIKSLDDYIDNFSVLLKKAVDFGIVCLKDQTAYRRIIDYNNPSKTEAESIFNKIISNPRDIFSSNEVRPLDDWLFHNFINLAKQYKLPIQIHTGHMAGIRNDIVKANAAHLIKVIELHSDVAFDLFHGNWPYMGEYLFIGKNYPNAYLDLCWVQTIDPLYSIELMKRAIVTVPHNKIMIFGGDTNKIENTIGYLELAKDNVAYALSEMIEMDYLSKNEAGQIAVDWFFNNPNELFNLGLKKLERKI